MHIPPKSTKIAQTYKAKVSYLHNFTRAINESFDF